MLFKLKGFENSGRAFWCEQKTLRKRRHHWFPRVSVFIQKSKWPVRNCCVFKFLRRMVWTENVWCVFRAKPFSNRSPAQYLTLLRTRARVMQFLIKNEKSHDIKTPKYQNFQLQKHMFYFSGGKFNSRKIYLLRLCVWSRCNNNKN